MMTVDYRKHEEASPLFVGYDEQLLFWPYLVRGGVPVAGAVVLGSWRGADLYEVLGKAADAGCIAIEGVPLDALVAEIRRRFELRAGTTSVDDSRDGPPAPPPQAGDSVALR